MPEMFELADVLTSEASAIRLQKVWQHMAQSGMKYEIQNADNSWSVCVRAEATSNGWLNYELADGTIGLKRPNTWRCKMALHEGAVCSRCARTVTQSEYSSGASKCCSADVIAEEAFK